MVENKNLRQQTWNKFPTFRFYDAVSSWTWDLIALAGKYFTYIGFFVNRLLIPFSSATSIFGFLLLLAILFQLLSGFFLGWYYIPEPGLVIEMREEMFEDTRFGMDVFYAHVRGVDVIFILSYFHIMKKFYLKNYITSDSEGWMLGGYAFLWFHYVVGLGICLSATHLSDLTLTIAANIYWSLTNNLHKSYYFIFTNRHLNTDQLTRLMMLHYLTPWYYLYLVKLHILFCHEGWDSDSEKSIYEDKFSLWITWFFDAFHKELQDSWNILMAFITYFWAHHFEIDSVAYYFFERWNISELDEMRFYGVAPHWYFKPLMGLLTIAPTHFEGVMWLLLYFLLLSSTPVLYNFYNSNFKNYKIIALKDSRIQNFFFSLFMLALFTSASLLPCGRYYYDLEGGYVGNIALKYSYQYVYFYLGWLLHHLDHFDKLLYRTARHNKDFIHFHNPNFKRKTYIFDSSAALNNNFPKK